MKQNRFVIYVGKDMLDDAFRDMVGNVRDGCLSEYIKHRVVLAELLMKSTPLSNPLDTEEVGRAGYLAGRGHSVVAPTSAPTLVQETSAPIENHGQEALSDALDVNEDELNERWRQFVETGELPPDK